MKGQGCTFKTKIDSLVGPRKVFELDPNPKISLEGPIKGKKAPKRARLKTKE